MRKLSLWLTLCVGMLLSFSLPAQTYTFTGVGDWTENNKWTPTPPPDPLTTGEIIINGNCNLNTTFELNGLNAKLTINGSMTINSGRTLRNEGSEIEIEPGASLSNNGTLRNRGTIVNDGTLINNFVGTVTGDGTVVGNLDNNGILDLGTGAVWTFTITGNYTAGPTALHIIEIRNNDNGNPRSDEIRVDGTANLNGTLTIVVDNANIIQTNDIFMPLRSGNIVGSFSTINYPANSTSWMFSYVGNNLTLTYLGAPFPIELLSFTGRQVDHTISLRWETATEQHNAYMAVERSRDGIRFSEIGQRKGAGTSYDLQQYSFTDTAPFVGINYYRLRQVDLDGKATYHPVTTVAFEGKSAGGAGVQLFPTLADRELTLVLPQSATTQGVVRIVDIGGKVLRQQPLASNASWEVVSVQDLTAGSYFLVVQNGQRTETLRFVKY